MTLTEEYEHQNQWRDWNSYLPQLPIKETDLILDLGCGTGQVTQLLAERSLKVIGVDHNPELLQAAQQYNHHGNVTLINANLRNYEYTGLPMADGIWSSFTAAYFPDFNRVLAGWLKGLKPGGWIALVEIDHLFGHHPLSKETEAHFKAHYKKLQAALIYDFEMGSKLKDCLLANGLNLVSEQNMSDIELSFNGPANEQVIEAWKKRLDRMTGLQHSLDNDQFQRLKTDFLSCLKNEKHVCSSTVKFLIAKNNVI